MIKKSESRAFNYPSIAGTEGPPNRLKIKIPFHFRSSGPSGVPCSSVGQEVQAEVIDYDTASRIATVQVVCPTSNCKVVLTPNVHY